MPQLDFFTYFTQIFWCFSSFIVLYFSIKYYILVPIAKLEKIRREFLIKNKKPSTLPKINTFFW